MSEFTDVEQSIKSLLLENIRSVKDFPKPGIIFKDITPLLNDSYLLELTSMLLAKPFRGQKIDHVADLESRGFLFGTNLAQDLHAALFLSENQANCQQTQKQLIISLNMELILLKSITIQLSRELKY